MQNTAIQIEQRKNPVSAFWKGLTRPHPSITDIETRRQSRLLAALALTVVVTTLFAQIYLISRPVPAVQTVFSAFIGQLVTLAAYFLNRSGRYRPAALLFVGINFILVFVGAIATHEVAWLLFGPMLMILGAIFLPFKGTVRLFVVSIIALILINIFSPLLTTFGSGGAFVVFLIVSTMVLVFMSHRTGVERERQAELQIANQRLRESEIALERRVEERTRELSAAKEQAETAREEAEQSNRVKSQFLAAMSHELRTPLNAIINLSIFGSKGMLGETTPQQVDAMDKITDSGKHLLALINDVLDISKIESGALQLYIEDKVDLNAELNTVFNTAKTLVGDKPVEVKLDCEPLESIRGDRLRIRQIILNLVSNACKFTDEGHITIRVKQAEGSTLIAVEDTGPGIPASEYEVIFDTFHQTEVGLRKGKGTGLGLSISRRLAQAHHGRLWLESTVGQGTTFFVSLPIRSEALVPSRVTSKE